MKVTVKTEGFAELDRALAELPKATGKGVLRRVLAKAAEPIYRAAKDAAPERSAAERRWYKIGGAKKERRPGTLHALVQSGTRLTRNQARLARKEGKNSAEHYVGTRDAIGRLVEYGTAETPAHPYLRPAWDRNKDKALEIMKTSLWEEIKKAADRLAKKAAKAGRK